MFIGTGWGKLHSIPDVTEFFTSLHIPAPGFNARLTAAGPLSIDGLIGRRCGASGAPDTAA